MIRLIEQYDLDLFRIDFNPLYTYEGAQTQRGNVTESNYWRYYEAFYGMFERVQRSFPHVTFQQCSAGGARNDLGMTSRFHEAYLTDLLWLPHVLQNYAGMTMGTSPERIVIAFGACREGIGYPENFDTLLRCIYGLGTPMMFGGVVAPDVPSLTPERREAFRRYGALYRDFMRPVLPTSRMFHHAPISARGGVSSCGWFCVEFAAPDASRGWAVIARLGRDDSDVFRLMPRGLDPARTYRVTFDSLKSSVLVDGLRLMHDGLSVRLEMIAGSELVLFEAT